MKKRSLVLCVVSIIIALIALLGFAACDDNSKSEGGNGTGMLFDKGTTPEKIVEMIGNGDIKNYTLAVTDDEHGVIYYMGDKSFYGYQTMDESPTWLMAFLEDEILYYLILEDGNVTAYKYANNSNFYINCMEEYLSFKNASIVVDMLTDLTVEKFSVEGNQITWISTSDNVPNVMLNNCRLYNVNNTNYVLPQELKNFREIAVDGPDEW